MVNGGDEKMTMQTAISPTQIRRIGLDVLSKSLGPVGMVRFLQQFETGRRNYTKDREEWLKELDVKSIMKQIKNSKRRNKDFPH